MKNTKAKLQIDKLGIGISLVVVGAVIAFVLINPELGNEVFVSVRDYLNKQLGAAFLWIGFICVIVCGYLSLSKYGHIRLGNKKSKYSTFTWCAMMFCACMGASLQFWSVIEWSYYYQASPLGMAEPFTARAAEVGLAYAFFHWSLTPWAFYAVGTIAMAYMYYIRQSQGLKCSNICEGVIGKKGVNGVVGRSIDVIFNIAIVIGLACTFGTGVYMVSSGWAEILGVPNNTLLTIIIIFSVALIFVTSSYLGLDKGMAKVADVNTYFAIGFAILLFVVGDMQFIINSATNSIGIVANNFIEMSLWTDPIAQSGFPESWTMFYWGFWIGTAPFFWLFATKISEGRKIKDVINWMMIAGLMGTILYFGVISNYAIGAQLDGSFDMVNQVATLGPDNAITAFIKQLPGGILALISWTVVATLFLATSMDSGAFALASNTQKGLKLGEEPNKMLRMFWCVVLTGLPIGFIMSGAPLEALKASGNISGFPIIIVMSFAIITLFRYLKKDFGNKTSHEIQKQFEKVED